MILLRVSFMFCELDFQFSNDIRSTERNKKKPLFFILKKFCLIKLVFLALRKYFFFISFVLTQDLYTQFTKLNAHHI